MTIREGRPTVGARRPREGRRWERAVEWRVTGALFVSGLCFFASNSGVSNPRGLPAGERRCERASVGGGWGGWVVRDLIAADAPWTLAPAAAQPARVRRHGHHRHPAASVESERYRFAWRKTTRVGEPFRQTAILLYLHHRTGFSPFAAVRLQQNNTPMNTPPPVPRSFLMIAGLGPPPCAPANGRPGFPFGFMGAGGRFLKERRGRWAFF